MLVVLELPFCPSGTSIVGIYHHTGHWTWFLIISMVNTSFLVFSHREFCSPSMARRQRKSPEIRGCKQKTKGWFLRWRVYSKKASEM